jgi:hypothetical protein
VKRQDVYGFNDHDSSQELETGLGPRPRTHLPELLQPELRLRIGSREFKLERRDPAATRILLVEKDLLIRAALAALLGSWKGFHVVAEARTAKEALAQRHMSPDVVLVSVPSTADSAMITEVSLAYGPDRLVVLLGHDAENFRFEMGRHSHRVLMKNAQPRTLKKAIEGIPARQC